MKYQAKPGFTLIGNGFDAKGVTMKPIDLLSEVMIMSTAEKLCFETIRKGIVYSPEDNRLIYQVHVLSLGLNKTKQAQFRKGFSLLSKKDLVRRIGTGTYMINPNALIPADYEIELQIWNKASPNKSTINPK